MPGCYKLAGSQKIKKTAFASSLERAENSWKKLDKSVSSESPEIKEEGLGKDRNEKSGLTSPKNQNESSASLVTRKI
ncbi:MAG: hypothetical protein BGO39_16090 [Chloroflexi bacterium 54-19]|nr:MAG: hypothetical protein BGO39_16090 [Chloroflexi bacterium 54-19]